jgi:uncharacterized membrane protein YfcA
MDILEVDTPTIMSGAMWGSAVLIFSLGVLLTAGGGGGGGVFVAILVLIGELSGHAAVPMSKFIILWGAVASFIANTVRMPDCLDWVLIRAMAPMSLAGTLVGIALNGAASETVLMVLLATLLSAIFARMVVMTMRKWNAQVDVHVEEKKKAYEIMPSPTSSTRSNSIANEDTLTPIEFDQNMSAHLPDLEDLEVDEIDSPPYVPLWTRITTFISSPVSMESKKNTLTISLVPTVILFGVLSRSVPSSPVLGWMLFFFPLLCCCGVNWYIRKQEESAYVYPVVGLGAGVASGLLGMGGGLIYTPFLLHMGIPSAVAIGVASTCVLFASASSALQYLFIGRIVSISVALFLAFFNVLASLSAAVLIEQIQKRLKPAALLVFVTITVGVSATFALIKTIHLIAN